MPGTYFGGRHGMLNQDSERLALRCVKFVFGRGVLICLGTSHVGIGRTDKLLLNGRGACNYRQGFFIDHLCIDGLINLTRVDASRVGFCVIASRISISSIGLLAVGQRIQRRKSIVASRKSGIAIVDRWLLQGEANHTHDGSRIQPSAHPPHFKNSNIRDDHQNERISQDDQPRVLDLHIFHGGIGTNHDDARLLCSMYVVTRLSLPICLFLECFVRSIIDGGCGCCFATIVSYSIDLCIIVLRASKFIHSS